MKLGIEYGHERLTVDVPEGSIVGVHRQPPVPALASPAAAVRDALEKPVGFPALRRALTPDDHVAIVLDEAVPHLPELLTPILEHLTDARVAPKAVTVLCPPSQSSQEWVDELPDAFEDVRIEVHDPSDRKRLSYLATTRHGRRIYLNRTAVDADQLVVLARRRYDPLLGYAGSEGTIYPAFSDEATRKELTGLLSLDIPGDKPWPARREAAEVAWLLGAPFMVQVIEGAGDELIHVIGGPADTGSEALRLLNARWRVAVDGLADTVVASITGSAGRFGDFADALACAARVVKPQGKVVLLTSAAPVLGPGAELLRESEDAEEALKLLRQSTPVDMVAAFLWASAARRASIYLLSQLPGETAEELFTTPLDNASQVQRLLDKTSSCLFLSDAHKTMAVAS